VTALVASELLALAILDGAFSGFRSSVGRTGLIDHRAADWLAGRRGAALAIAGLLPVIVAVTADVLLRPARVGIYARAGNGMLAIYLPYGLIVLAALTVYLTLSWRKRYLAAAVILGPLTLLRPAVAVLGGALAAIASRDPVASACAVLSIIAVLGVGPTADRIWYARPPRRPAHSHCQLVNQASDSGPGAGERAPGAP
jgi:hypothetical protein